MFHEKSMFFSKWFSRDFLVFFNLATLTKHCNLHIETYFFTFSFFHFFIEKMTKNYEKLDSWKNIEKWPHGGPQMTLIFGVFFVVLAGLEKKGPKKYVFWGVDFWWFFGWPKKSFPGVIPGIGFWKIQPQASLGDLGGWERQPKCWLPNTPMGRWPGEFFIYF